MVRGFGDAIGPGQILRLLALMFAFPGTSLAVADFRGRRLWHRGAAVDVDPGAGRAWFARARAGRPRLRLALLPA